MPLIRPFDPRLEVIQSGDTIESETVKAIGIEETVKVEVLENISGPVIHIKIQTHAEIISGNVAERFTQVRLCGLLHCVGILLLVLLLLTWLLLLVVALSVRRGRLTVW